MSKIVTYETVAAAAESLAKDDKRPSVRAVIAVLGGGSPNAVLPLLNQWKAGRPTVAAAEIQVDPRIAQIIGEQIVKATTEARGEIEQRLAELEADAQALAESGRQAEAELESSITQVQQLTAQTQSMAGQIEQLKADTETVKREAAEQIERTLNATNDELTRLESVVVRERSDRESAQVALAKAELRLEALPALQDEVKQLRVDLDAERLAKSAAEAKAASAEAKAAGLADRLADAQTAAATESKAAADRLADVKVQASAAASVADARLAEQAQASVSLVASLRAEIERLQTALASASQTIAKK